MTNRDLTTYFADIYELVVDGSTAVTQVDVDLSNIIQETVSDPQQNRFYTIGLDSFYIRRDSTFTEDRRRAVYVLCPQITRGHTEYVLPKRS